MADLADLSLAFDRVVFTSLPSAAGEGYRVVAASPGARQDERAELTRRAPSHGSLSDEKEWPRGAMVFALQCTKRVAVGLVRVSGAEHTQRGGGRVWTDFLLADAATAAVAAIAPARWREAVAALGPLKPPFGSTPLARVEVPRPGAEGHAPAYSAGTAPASLVAGVAALLVGAGDAVIAVGRDPAGVFEDALAMLPAFARPGVEATAALRYSPARGVRRTVVPRLDPETLRVVRGRPIACVDAAAQAPAPASGPLASWLALAGQWWQAGRAAELVALADRMGRPLAEPGIEAATAAAARGDQAAFDAAVSGH